MYYERGMETVDLGDIALFLEGLRDEVAMGETIVEESYIEKGSHRTVIKISTISAEQRGRTVQAQADAIVNPTAKQNYLTAAKEETKDLFSYNIDAVLDSVNKFHHNYSLFTGE